MTPTSEPSADQEPSANEGPSPANPSGPDSSYQPGLKDWLQVLAMVYLLLVGVALIGDGFKLATGGSEGAERIFSFASNPITGVILGTLATALVQSSSTVTSVIVALVAGGMPVSLAVPMIMGANMGTTITNTIVSLGNLGDGPAFKRSFQAATVHDFFNLFSILIFLPIEILFKPLERTAEWLSQSMAGSGSSGGPNLDFIGGATGPPADFLLGICQDVLGNWGGEAAIVLGVALIITSVIQLGQRLRKVMTGRAEQLVHGALGRSKERGVASGMVITVLVQSSSTTTSLVVPMAGAGVLSIREVFPFTMGANLGTCITALLAAMSVEGPAEVVAMQIALVHLLYNIAGVLAFLYVPVLGGIPIRCAKWLGARTQENRAWALGYIAAVFFVLPATVFLFVDTDASQPVPAPITEEIGFELE